MVVVVVALQVTESESSFRKESTVHRGPDNNNSNNNTEAVSGTGRVKRAGYHHQQQHYKPRKLLRIQYAQVLFR